MVLDLRATGERKSGIPSIPTIADTYRADTNRLIMECHEGAVPSHNKTTAMVGVAMREHNTGRVSTQSQKATEPTTVQVSRPKRKAEVVRQNSHSLPPPEHNQLREGGVTRERKNQRHSKRCRMRCEILGAAVLEESELSPGGAASSTRSSNDEHIDNVSSSPAVQREETDETHRGSGYYRRRLESTKKKLRQRSQ